MLSGHDIEATFPIDLLEDRVYFVTVGMIHGTDPIFLHGHGPDLRGPLRADG